jgi:hypothetical protein
VVVGNLSEFNLSDEDLGHSGAIMERSHLQNHWNQPATVVTDHEGARILAICAGLWVPSLHHADEHTPAQIQRLLVDYITACSQ